MHTEEWSGSRVAAVLALLKDAGYSQSRMARLAGIGDRSTVNRWSRGENRPGPDAVRRLAAAVWPRQPELARELVEASGYPWVEPQREPEPLVPPEVLEVLERVYKGEPERLREAVQALESIERERRQTGASPGERRAG
jgi:transcriptional regulator with XRE-family HTH domain